jgi:nucleotide-binding universal stress UspA family protein
VFETAVVGWDGRPAAEEAVRWVLRRPVAARSRLVRVVGDDDQADAADRALQAELARLAADGPGERIGGEVARGDATTELGRRTSPSVLLVLGTDRAPAPPWRRSTTAARLAARANGPVVVVPQGTADRRGFVLVGVDDGPASRAAARRAAEIATATASSLLVLHAWRAPGEPTDPPILEQTPDGIGVPVDALGDLVPSRTLPRSRIALLRSVVAGLRAAFPDLAVDGRLVHGAAARALRQEAAHASLVVVGRRSRWTPSAVLLGSATHALLLTSPAPVLVVGRHDAPADPAPLGADRRAAG